MNALQLDRLSDEEVATAAAVSPQEAFEVLFDRYRAPVFSFIHRQVRDSGRAEDLFQNTFLKMYRALPGFRHDARFRTWLFTIAANSVTDDRRREGRRGPSAGLEEGMAVHHETAGRGMEHDEAVALLRQALDELPPAHRQLFLLVRFQELKIAEAAEAVGLSPGSAKVTLFRIQQKIGQALRSRLAAGGGAGRER